MTGVATILVDQDCNNCGWYYNNCGFLRQLWLIATIVITSRYKVIYLLQKHYVILNHIEPCFESGNKSTLDFYLKRHNKTEYESNEK